MKKKKGKEDEDVCFVSGFDLETLEKKIKIEKVIEKKEEKIYKLGLSAIIKQLLQYNVNNNYYSQSSIQNIVLGLKNGTNGNQGKEIYVLGSEGKDGISTLVDFFNGGTSKAVYWKDLINQPLFHLSLASGLKTQTKTDIPFVEYQILYKSTQNDNKPIITNPTVISSGKSGGYTINMETSVTKQTGTYGYALVGK